MRHAKDRVGFEIEASPAPDRVRTDEEEPFRIALLADFSGRSQRPPLEARKSVLIDRDNFDEVLEKLGAGVELPAGRIAMRDLEDFHPDSIYRTHPLFRQLRAAREKLANPETFAEAARDLMGEAPAPVPAPGGGNLLGQILGEAATAVSRAKPVDDLQRLIREAVRPHLVAREDPQAPELIRQVDEAATSLMRAILHSRKFRALESVWRTVFRLTRTLETGPDLKIYLADITREELAADPDGVYDMLVQRSGPWAVIAGAYAFGASDCQLMSILGLIARKAGAPFLAEADLSLIDSPQYAAFRKTPEAAHIGLAFPRVLLRLPYGRRTAPCEAFDFEEVAGKPEPGQMLYGSPAFLLAMLLGQAFESGGWGMRPGIVRDIPDLPVYVYQEDGDSIAFPCAEAELTQEAAEAAIALGLIPVAAYRNRDFARALMFQSVADPPGVLPGRWA